MRKTLIFGITCSIILVACKTDQFDVDISDIQVEVKIKRFEKDLFDIDFDSITEYIPFLKEEYGKFFEDFNTIINIGQPNSMAYPDLLKGFLTDYMINEVYNKCQEIFPDVNELNKKLSDAFKHYKYYFPDHPIPKIFTYISGFNAPMLIDENILGIGIDDYLGTDCEFYERLKLPRYKRVNKHKGKILSDCMKAWAISEYEFNDSIDNLLSNMIYFGKVLYFVRAMLPGEPDTLIMGYSSSQLEWCKMNEEKMWGHLIEKKLLFSSHYLTINKFINDGPFTSAFTQKSPSRAAAWIGWQIVTAYMKNNTGLSLETLMKENDYQKILTLSKYKP